jgi:redox-sensitive bicupin YhaK (pirin superfamily)
MGKNDLRKRAAENNGEYVFGTADTGSHACYVIYGILKPREKKRVICPGRGHEEILLSVKGSITVTGHYNASLEEGHAVHLAGEQSCFLENCGESEAVYVVAGGHSGHGHTHSH